MIEISQLKTSRAGELRAYCDVTIEGAVFGDDAENELNKIRQFINNRATVEIREKTEPKDGETNAGAEEQNTWRRGSVYREEGDHSYQAGINREDHHHKIVVYGSEREAETLRDSILGFLQNGGDEVRTRKAVREALDRLARDLPSMDASRRVEKWADIHYPVLKTPEQIGAEVLEKINAAESIEEAMNACKEGFKVYRDAKKAAGE